MFCYEHTYSWRSTIEDLLFEIAEHAVIWYQLQLYKEQSRWKSQCVFRASFQRHLKMNSENLQYKILWLAGTYITSITCSTIAWIEVNYQLPGTAYYAIMLPSGSLPKLSWDSDIQQLLHSPHVHNIHKVLRVVFISSYFVGMPQWHRYLQLLFKVE